MQKFILILGAIATLSSQPLHAQVKLLSDVPYLTPDRAEKLDAYLPPESFPRPLPAVLLIHGGGWETNDKANKREQNIGNTLAENGYAVFSINYLLYKRGVKDTQGNFTEQPVYSWPQNIYDCKSALRFLKKEAATYGIDPKRIAVMGGSAGGHLAMLVGVTSHVDELNKGGLYLDQDNRVRCIINMYGIHDLRQFLKPKAYGAFRGATTEESEANLTKASPKNYLDKDTPPVLILHGTGDKTVSVDVSRDLVKMLKEKNIPYKYIEIPNAPHTFHLQPKEMDLRPAVLEFLKENLN